MQSNRLINEKSPYLLQHAHNPVDWYPWSDAAFQKAAEADKPVFLSIGYATCHWCHVMERESFEDEEAAGYLNDTFIPIKVDREERPDIDAVYMAVCQMLTGRGGWPLTIFMTPDKKPFFAGTYIPKQGRFGQGGLIDICKQVKQLWREDRKKVLDSAESISGHLNGAFAFAGTADIDESALDHAYEMSAQSYDPHHGGFDPAPKFPTPHRLRFLLHQYDRTGNENALNMVRHTLTAMRHGGIWDHIGFGFHRYSTDAHWLLPHFEKMLYDQALLATAYLEAYQITGDPLLGKTAEEIFTYVLRDMTSEEGGFFAAEDADSEGEEGKFYIWTRFEFESVLGPEEGPFWADILNLTAEGNFADESTGKKTGVNIPHLTRSFQESAEALDLTALELRDRWEKARALLFDHREKRIHPLKDDKVLTDWNGLLIAALALGARVLKNPAYAEAAEKAARFIETRLEDDHGRLLHRYREGEAGIEAHADDYAFMIWGLTELYRTTFDPQHLARAVKLQERMVADFWDPESGGFYLTAESSRDLPVRPKELYDGAVPSANSVALLNLLRLSRLTGDTKWEERASALSRGFSGSVAKHPSAFTQFLIGLDFAMGQTREVVLVGDPDSEESRRMTTTLDERFAPHQVVLFKPAGAENALAEIAEFTRSLNQEADRTTAYVCRDFACSRPTTDVDTLIELVTEKA